jgi:hypothetical protein
MTPLTLPEESVRFRRFLIDELWINAIKRTGRRAFGYETEDVFWGRCPICGSHVEVCFAGLAPRATLDCEGGCTEDEIADRLGVQVGR